jgi:hypothetical protein
MLKKLTNLFACKGVNDQNLKERPQFVAFRNLDILVMGRIYASSTYSADPQHSSYSAVTGPVDPSLFEVEQATNILSLYIYTLNRV